ncbi:virulence plasmid 65kDa B protein-domain-containing protein [Cladorrhinum sp. PSN259]|nr:virulence plasmid 65kDa B protein-domain-containing protein [Cladorrhinum sp. PSN259]
MATQTGGVSLPYQGRGREQSNKGDTNRNVAGEVRGSKPSAGSTDTNGAASTGQNAPSRLTPEGSDQHSVRERFDVDLQTWGVSFRLPIHTSPGRNGFGPSLSLVHNSGCASANGIFGAGWNLKGAESIRSKTALAIPTYDDDEDIFVHSSVRDLVPVVQASNLGDGRALVEWDETDADIANYRVRLYRARYESASSPMRIERWTRLSHRSTDAWHTIWKTIAPDNMVTIYGSASTSRIGTRGDVGGNELVFAWLATDIYDGYGNGMSFSYRQESLSKNPTDAQRYLHSIKYGNKKPNRDLESWAWIPEDPGCLEDSQSPSRWAFEVIFDYGGYAGELTSSQQVSNQVQEWALRPDPFSDYRSGFEIRTRRRCERVLMFHHFEQKLGQRDYLVAATDFSYEINSRSGVSELVSVAHCGYQMSPSSGKPTQGRLPPFTFKYQKVQDLSCLPVEEIEIGVAGSTAPGHQWVDLNGEGAPGLLATVAGGAWYYCPNNSNDTNLEIGQPSVVSHIPSLSDSTEWTLVDLAGDGRLKFFSSSADFNLHGFHQREEKHGGEDTWSNFVPLASYPTDMGARTSDLMYLPPEGGLHVYYNQSGNSWSDVEVLDSFPALDSNCSVDIFDIGGRGTQCLVWTPGRPGADAGSTTLRFIDLMGGRKPGMLAACDNGMGSEVALAYRSSKHYFLDDQRAGRPWTTKLPFPMHCVERMVTTDHVSGTCCTRRFAYHNGSYDVSERQFHGFQMVEEWDAEGPTGASLLIGHGLLHRPPAHTKTWYYVGSEDIDGDEQARHLWGAFEADVNPRNGPLPGAQMPSQPPLTGEEHEDPHRALAGHQRRQEIFSDDASSKCNLPYVVSQQTYEVVMRQSTCRALQSKYASFRVNGREELSSHYERGLGDPKTQHTMTLETDDWGNICKQIVINYGKMASQLETEHDRQKQQDAFILYTETDHTNAIGNRYQPPSQPGCSESQHFHAPLPSETREFRVLPASSWQLPSSSIRLHENGQAVPLATAYRSTCRI